MIITEQLRNYTLFKDLDEADLQLLAACMAKRYYKKNTYIFHPGNQAAHLYLIESGLVRLFFNNQKGEEFLLNLVRPGAWFGHPLMLEPQFRLMGAAAQQPTVVLTLAYSDLFQVMATSHQLNFNLYTEMSTLSRKLLQHYQSFLTVGLEGRVAYLLLHLRETNGDEIFLPISQTRMASWLGVSRGKLNRTLIKFQKLDLIQIDGALVRILNVRELARIAENLPDLAL
jgi:CRP-like cAMP-binding protein